jgi:hypothetical protein
VSKKYLAQYGAVFEWSHNVKQATEEFLNAMVGSTSIKGT